MSDRKVNNVTFTQLKILAKILFTSQKKVVYLLLFGQLCIVLLQEIVGYAVGLVPSHFFLVLGTDAKDRSHSQFTILVIYAATAAIILSFIKASNMLITGLLYISWRDGLTKSLHKRYFALSHTVYRANEKDTSKDNPDQRIASDASALTDDLSQFVPVILVSPFTITYYTYKCWQITSYIGPVIVFAFFVLATIVNKLLMNPVAKLTYKQEQFEGDFRYSHMLIRSNCEASAFYHLNQVEEKQSDKSLSSLLAVQERLTYFKYMQNMFIVFCDYIVSIASYVIVSIPIFSGQYDSLTGAELSSAISQYCYQSIYLFNCFTKLTDLAKQASTFLGNSQRVADFIEALDAMDKYDRDDDILKDDAASNRAISDRSCSDTNLLLLDGETFLEETSTSHVEIESRHSYKILPVGDILVGECVLAMENITIQIPNTTRVLLSNFSYQFVKGTNVLITGPSGVGKSSLLRLIGRLWRPYSGHVTLRGDVGIGCSISIIPQKPFFLTGQTSLADQIYLGTTWPCEHSEISGLLEELGLQEVIHRYGGLTTELSTSWYDVLTPGEAQRLSIVRALYHKPVLLFLDEATSQVDAVNEQKMYELLSSRDITLVSVGHRESIRRYHTIEISISADTHYSISHI